MDKLSASEAFIMKTKWDNQRQELIEILNMYEKGTPSFSNQGQALDGYSALENFISVVKTLRSMEANDQQIKTFYVHIAHFDATDAIQIQAPDANTAVQMYLQKKELIDVEHGDVLRVRVYEDNSFKNSKTFLADVVFSKMTFDIMEE